MTTLAITLLPDGSLVDLGKKEALPHVNDPTCVRVLGHVVNVFFIQSPHLGLVPGILVLVALIHHISIVGVNQGHGKVNQGVLPLHSAPDLVLALDVDKLLASQARSLEHL